MFLFDKRFTLLIIVLSALDFKGQALINGITANPNPFVKRTLISYTVSSQDTISIEIMNLLGVHVGSLRTNFVVFAGTYQDSLVMDNFPAGIYLVVLKNKQGKNLGNAKISKTQETNILEINPVSSLKIYPNPVKTKLYVEFEFNASSIGNMKLYISNFLGQEMYSFSLHEVVQKQEIDVSFLPPGFYFFRLQNTSKQQVFKIVKE